MERANLQVFLERGLSLEQIGKQVGKHPSTVGYWVQKHGLCAANRERHRARGEIGRETLTTLVEAGATISEIATAVGRSRSAVRHWLARYQLRTLRSAQRVAGAGPPMVSRRCRTHGQTEFVLEGRGYYRCRRCRIARSSEQRRRDKRRLVRVHGDRCARCGYDRCVAALEFHHLDPRRKSFDISRGSGRKGSARLADEAAKCVLLCSNCHAEVEAELRGVDESGVPRSAAPSASSETLSVEGRAQAEPEGERRGPTVRCQRHGVGAAYLEAGRPRCKRCRAEAVVRWRRRLKRRLVAEAGGRCCRCGYDRFQGALEFHHLDPDNKRFAIGASGVARAYAIARAEALTCLLLCSNCHAEAEAGRSLEPTSP